MEGSFGRHGLKKGFGVGVWMDVEWIRQVGWIGGGLLEDMAEDNCLGFWVLKSVVWKVLKLGSIETHV